MSSFNSWVKHTLNTKGKNLYESDDGIDNCWIDLKENEKKLIIGLSKDLMKNPQIDDSITDEENNVQINIIKNLFKLKNWVELFEVLQQPVRKKDLNYIFMMKGTIWLFLKQFEVADYFFNKIG